MPAYWAAIDLDPEEDRDGASARFVVVHTDDAGEPDGAASYRLQWTGPPAARTSSPIEDVVAASDAVALALVDYLLDVDLVTRVEWHAAPVDHPLRWRAADPRAVTVTGEKDHLWLRPLDVARCLAARTYAAADGLVVEVVDDDRPEVGGRFRLDANRRPRAPRAAPSAPAPRPPPISPSRWPTWARSCWAASTGPRCDAPA